MTMRLLVIRGHLAVIEHDGGTSVLREDAAHHQEADRLIDAHLASMSEAGDPDYVRHLIAAILSRYDVSITDLASAAGVGVSTIRRAMAGTHRTIPSVIAAIEQVAIGLRGSVRSEPPLETT